MTKSYTLSYFINTYQMDQSNSTKIGSEEVRGDDMMLKSLGEFQFSPSEQSVQNILNFSKSYEVLNSRLTQSIELIQN